MMRVRSFLAGSPIHGVGCFTHEAIAKGQLVWEFDRGFDREYSAAEVSRLPASTRCFFETHAWASPRKTILVCADHGGYFNHEEEANTGMTPDGFRCVARRDISAGAELTTNYEELPDAQVAAAGPSSPIFKAIPRGALGGAAIALTGHGPGASWSLAVGTVSRADEATHVADGLNRLVADGVLRIENVAPAAAAA
jgi:hypothetical protein